jgi:peptidoglycan/xylan/chitin deacetylase (PgdA/CDA1 family)
MARAGHLAGDQVAEAIFDLTAQSLFQVIARPKNPSLTIITTFQTGHGWTAGSNNAENTNLNDTTDFVLGSQAAKVETLGNGTGTTLSKTGMSALDMTGRMFQVWVKVSDVSHLNELRLYAGDTNFTNFYILNVLSVSGSSAIKTGEWIPVRFGFNNATVGAGSPNRAAITDLRLRMVDDNTGTKIVLHFNGIAHLADPTPFPNGVVSLTFDDGDSTQYTEARKKMSEYGYAGTAYLARDLIGTGGYMTLAQLQDLVVNSGWEMGAHADTAVSHNLRFTNISTDVLHAELQGCKLWLRTHGLGPGDHFAYPGGSPTDWSTATEDIVRQYFRTARLNNNWPRQKLPPVMPYRLGSTGITSGVTIGTLQTEVDRCVAEKDWLILNMHDIPADISVANFNTLINYLNSSGVAVRTVGDVIASL